MQIDPPGSYSRKPGESIYKIEPGFVYLLNDKKRLKNRAFGLKVDHHTYIWIHAVWPIRKGQQPKKRKVSVVICHIPLLKSFQKIGMMIEKSTVQREYIATKLRNGAQKVATIKWGDKNNSYRKFYKKIGIL